MISTFFVSSQELIESSVLCANASHQRITFDFKLNFQVNYYLNKPALNVPKITYFWCRRASYKHADDKQKSIILTAYS